ncbi:MAG: SH3 domain-containing protein, partial [Alphaproteobacteria bacterium]|nr:SH3 domain-containing protein [Alphaproteobacteria bacterium]
NPYIDRGACPFECCTYRVWTTNLPVSLLDKPAGKTVVAKVPTKTGVTGVTGEVHSTPLRVVASHAFEGTPIKKGDVLFALHYAGEGFFTVWFKGKTYDVDFSEGAESSLPLDKTNQSWWVQIRTKDGKTGWVLDKNQFDNQDSCG